MSGAVSGWVVPAVAAPTARQLRARLRESRKRHSSKSFGDFLTDVYLLTLLLGMYGYVLVNAVHGYLRTPSGGHGDPVERYWIGIAVLLAGVGLAWQALRAAGPLLVTPAAYTWCAATPVDRRGWLLPRLVGLLAGSAGLVAALSLAADGIGDRSSLAWAATAGATLGLTAAALAVAAQTGPTITVTEPTADPAGGSRRWPGLLGTVTIGLGVAAVGTVIAAHFLAYHLPRPALPVVGFAVVGLPLAATTATVAVRRLHRLDRATLTSGAQLATAAVTAAAWLDPSMLSDVLQVRRWRRIGRVRSRRFSPGARFGAGARPWVLLQAEVRRQVRHPSALAIWGALALSQYAVWLAVPAVARPLHLLGAYLAAERLAGGLRTICGSAGLRRALGGGNTELRLIHIVVPAVGTALWWLVTWPAAGGHLGSTEWVPAALVVAAAYRSATRPPMIYGGTTLDTPFGLIPVDLLRRLARGPDVLAAAIIVSTLLA
ncbi:MAG: hypothetical protein QOE03_259 [Micromonosporaceae bacterium]|nr:hypothetical protein [Micromonosporaceae bacterium]